MPLKRRTKTAGKLKDSICEFCNGTGKTMNGKCANCNGTGIKGTIKESHIEPTKVTRQGQTNTMNYGANYGANKDYNMTAKQLGVQTAANHLQTNQTGGRSQIQPGPYYKNKTTGKDSLEELSNGRIILKGDKKDKPDLQNPKNEGTGKIVEGKNQKGGNGSAQMGSQEYQTAVVDQMQCLYCGGTGQCPTCQGKGWIKDDEGHKPDDKECEGTGSCVQCNGTGMVDSPDADKNKSPNQKAAEIKKQGITDPDEVVEKKKKDSLEEADLLHTDSGEVARFEHWDAINIAPSYMVMPFAKTVEGYLRGRAIVTGIGVFEYKNPDGSIQRELRTPDEVFNSDSLNSLKLKPMTNDHPKVAVTAQNIQQFQVGNSGDNPSKFVGPYGVGNYGGPYGQDPVSDGYNLAVDLIIQKADAVNDVENGKRGLSCAYDCQLEKAPEGARKWGMPYDYIQKNIRYNHIAIVDKARAGDDAYIPLTMDGIDVVPANVLIRVDAIEPEIPAISSGVEIVGGRIINKDGGPGSGRKERVKESTHTLMNSQPHKFNDATPPIDPKHSMKCPVCNGTGKNTHGGKCGRCGGLGIVADHKKSMTTKNAMMGTNSSVEQMDKYKSKSTGITFKSKAAAIAYHKGAGYYAGCSGKDSLEILNGKIV